MSGKKSAASSPIRRTTYHSILVTKSDATNKRYAHLQFVKNDGTHDMRIPPSYKK